MNWKVRFINYPLHFQSMESEVMEIVRSVLSKGDLILRQQTEDFETDLARYCGTQYAIGVSNCTDALHLCYIAAGIGPGDEVITVSHTFVATVAGIVHVGAKPVFVDIGDDHNIDVDKIEAAITPRTKAIVPVSLNGRPCDLPKIKEIADKHGLIVIEDSAQALGATIQSRKAGSWGLAGCFSFYPAKLLGAFGDAGAIITDDANFAEQIRLLRNHGRTSTGVERWSFNSRIDNLHAAILQFKLTKLPGWILKRRELAEIYHSELADCPQLRLPPRPVESIDRWDVFQNYEVEAENRDALVAYLNENGIEILLPWGGKGVHQFEKLNLAPAHLPRTDQFFSQAFLLPMYPELTRDEVSYVCRVIRSFYDRSTNSAKRSTLKHTAST